MLMTTTRQVLVFMALLCGVAGCTGHRQVNTNCEWPAGSARGLSDDAESAEDLAIRYADAHAGPRSGHFAGFEHYRQTRDTCGAKLITAVAAAHNVPREEVIRAVSRRPVGFDTAVMLSFLMLYALGAYAIVSKLYNRFWAAQGVTTAVVMVVFLSLVLSAAGVLLVEEWGLVWESVRLSTGHLSYRVERIPWPHHRLLLFVLDLLVCWAVALIAYRRSPRTEALALSGPRPLSISGQPF